MSWKDEASKRIRGFTKEEKEYVCQRTNWKSVWNNESKQKFWILPIPPKCLYSVCVRGTEMVYSVGYIIIAPNYRGDPKLVDLDVITMQELQNNFEDKAKNRVIMQSCESRVRSY